MIKNLFRRLVSFVTKPVELGVLLSDEVFLLKKERLRYVSKLHMAVAMVEYHDNLIAQLEEEIELIGDFRIVEVERERDNHVGLVD